MKNHKVEPIKNRYVIVLMELYLASISKRNRLIFLLGINSGLRVSDILKLNIEDVRDKNFIEIVEKKTGKYKKFPLNKKLRMLIYDYLKTERADLVCLEKKSNPLFLSNKGKRISYERVYQILNQTCEDLNIEINIGTHSMRKTFAYHHYKKFNNVALLQKILNHSSQSITLKYIGLTQDEIDSSYSNFAL